MSAIQRFPTLRVGSPAVLIIVHPLTVVGAGTVGSGGWFHLRPR